jgi:transposase InsO family protein
MTPSYAFVGEPETNGVIERFFRTLKEQIVHGRIYQTIEEVRDTVRNFVARYNAEWLIEKNGLRSPSDARVAWHQSIMRAAA